MRYAFSGTPPSPHAVLAMATLLLVSIMIAAIYPHLKTDMAFERELYQQYKGCLETGGGPTGCTSFINSIRKIHNARDSANSACEAARAAALQSCAAEWENSWYDDGSENYPSARHLKDLPRCERVGQATFDACRNY